MARTKISEFSSTPASNTDIDSIFIGEGMAPSNVNDAIRELMAQLKDFQTGAVGDSFNGPVGTTTPAAGAFTTLSATGNVTLGDASTDTLNVGNGGLIKDSSGNLGLGVTPRAGWNSGFKALEFSGGYGAIAGQTAGAGVFSLSWGAYATGAGTWAYSTTGDTTNLFTMNSGLFKWYTAPSGTAGNAISFTQAMTLDASGNFILGATSASGRARIVGAASTDCGLNIDTSTNNYASFININALNDNGAIYNYIRSTTSGGTEHWKISGGAATSTMAFSTGGSERARIDSSGNLLINTTSASGKLTVRGSDISDVPLAITHAWGSSSTPLMTASNSSGEVMRLERSGNLLVGTTSGGNGRLRVSGSGDAFVSSYTSPSAGYFFSSNSGDANCVEIFQGRFNKTGLTMSNNNTGTITQIDFFQTGSSRGSITTNNSTTAYNTSSDYRLKEDIQPMTGALARVAALKPCTYKWKEDGSEGEGFIAHELQAVVPNAVTGEKDAVREDGSIKPQGIDTSFLVATLTAAIQELKAEFDAYKASHP